MPEEAMEAVRAAFDRASRVRDPAGLDREDAFAVAKPGA
jgi:hypothetical protein